MILVLFLSLDSSFDIFIVVTVLLSFVVCCISSVVAFVYSRCCFSIWCNTCMLQVLFLWTLSIVGVISIYIVCSTHFCIYSIFVSCRYCFFILLYAISLYHLYIMLCVVGVVYQWWGHGESNGGIQGQRAIAGVPTLACVCQPHRHLHTNEAARLPGQSIWAIYLLLGSQSLVYPTVTGQSVIGRFACYWLNSLSLGRICFIWWWFGEKELMLYMYLFVCFRAGPRRRSSYSWRTPTCWTRMTSMCSRSTRAWAM